MEHKCCTVRVLATILFFSGSMCSSHDLLDKLPSGTTNTQPKSNGSDETIILTPSKSIRKIKPRPARTPHSNQKATPLGRAKLTLFEIPSALTEKLAPTCASPFPHSHPYSREPWSWWGGDVGVSALIGNEAFFLFGDAIVIQPGDKPFMVSNNLRRYRCSNGRVTTEYLWEKNSASINPAMFNDNVSAKCRRGDKAPCYQLWPADVGVLPPRDGAPKGLLLVLLTKVTTTTDPGPFNFAVVGNSLAVMNIATKQTRILNLTLDAAAMNRPYATDLPKWSTFVVLGQDIYLFGTVKVAPVGAPHLRQIALFKFKIAEIEEPTRNIAYFSKSGSWKTWLPESAVTARDDYRFLMPAGGSDNGLNVRWIPEQNSLVAMAFSTFGKGEVYALAASDPRGPWSKKAILGTMPEFRLGSADADRNPVCYSLTVHPWINQDTFSYSCIALKKNSLPSGWPNLFYPLDMYVAHKIELAMPAWNAAISPQVVPSQFRKLWRAALYRDPVKADVDKWVPQIKGDQDLVRMAYVLGQSPVFMEIAVTHRADFLEHLTQELFGRSPSDQEHLKWGPIIQAGHFDLVLGHFAGDPEFSE